MTSLEKIKEDIKIVSEIKYPWKTIPVAISELKELVAIIEGLQQRVDDTENKFDE